MPDRARVLEIADALSFIREVPPGSNAGRWVEATQRVGGTAKGNPWCACWVSLVLGVAYAGAPPLAYTASCDLLLEEARRKGWLRDAPSVGAVFLRLKSDRDADHTGFVRALGGDGRFTTWEGNAAPNGSREGVGVYSLTRPRAQERYVFVDYPEAA